MRRRKLLLQFLLVLLSLAVGWMILTEWVFPPRLFRKAVLNPIPASVRHIKGSGFLQAKNCHTYVLRFRLSPEDVPLILASDRFKEIGCVEYGNGILTFGETFRSTRGFILFQGWRAWMPRTWCQCAKWSTFRAYCVEETDDMDFWKYLLFLYDPQHGEAYFINHLVRGNWAWSLF